MDEIYSVSELARDLGITPRTVRFYEDQGLILPQRAGNARVYTHRERARMKLILRGKRLGFSLKDIRDFLDLYVVDTSQTEQLRLLVFKVRERIGQLEDQRQALELTLGELRDIERMTDDALMAKRRAGE
jgi:DNA-binding transcriptional MerR regulator